MMMLLLKSSTFVPVSSTLQPSTRYQCTAVYNSNLIIKKKKSVAPVAYLVTLEPGIGQFREF